MRPLELEPELEDLLLRLVPELPNQWRGASEDEVAQIELIAGRPLPRFYRWFLLRMGRSMGSLSFPSLDFSISKIISSYAEPVFLPDRRFLMIGHESDLVVPLHVLYDFDHPARDDARITKRLATGGALHNQFETFREMIGWGKFLSYRIMKWPQRCVGLFTDRDGDVLAQLDPVLKSLAFEAPIPTGRCCAIYDSTRASLVSSSTPGDEPKFHTFELGGRDSGHLRGILGEIATETSLELEIEAWEPPL